MTMEYHYIIVESYYITGSGLRGPIHIRPLPGQDPFLPSMHVECSKELSYDYPVGTRFRIKAKITDREGTPFIYSHYKWPYEVVENS